MTRWRSSAILLCAGAVLVGCNRGPDPMSIVQSPAEFNCLGAVSEAADSRDVTLLALARTQTGAEAQVLADRDGTIWTCRTDGSGIVTGLRQGLGPTA